MRQVNDLPEIEELKKEVMAGVDSDLDAWEGFYEKYKEDYAKLGEYEKKIAELEEELRDRDNRLKRKLEKERTTLLGVTIVFLVVSMVFIQLISGSLNVWLYLIGGFMIGLGAFGLLYLWTR